jgi:ketosteroid isomerase-like protein
MEASNELKDMLMELDKKFDKDTSVGGVDAWVSYFAENGVMVISQGEDIKGREAIHNYMKGAFSLPEFSLRWQPIDGKISEDGTLGYTYGKYLRRYLDTEGKEIVSTGKYTSVWQKQAEGDWKISLDIGN